MKREGNSTALMKRDVFSTIKILCVTGSILLITGCATTPKKTDNSNSSIRPSDKSGARAAVETSLPSFETEKAVREILEKRHSIRMEKRNRLSGHTITLSAKDSSLRGALISLIKGTPYSISFGLGFTESKVTAEFTGLTLGEAIERLLYPTKLTYETEKNVIIIDSPALKTQMFRFDYPVSSRFSSGGAGGSAAGSQTDIWNDVGEAVSFIVFEKGAGGTGTGVMTDSDRYGQKLIISPTAGTILVTSTEDKLSEVESYLMLLERFIKRQILIEAMLLQVSLSDQFLFGLNLDYQSPFNIGGETLSGFLTPLVATPPSGTTAPGAPAITQRLSPDAGSFRIGLANKNFAILLDALKQAGKVDIVFSPKIATLNNQQAVITVATEEVYFLSKPGTVVVGQTGIPVVTETTYTPSTFTVGIVLEVLPQVSDDNHVTLRIHPNITSVVRTVASPKGDTQPVLDRKELTTIIRVQNDETIVIGGLIDDKITKDRRGIPLLMDIPYLGSLFTRIEDKKEKREMMIFLTPRILEGPTISKLSDDERMRLEKHRNPGAN